MSNLGNDIASISRTPGLASEKGANISVGSSGAASSVRKIKTDHETQNPCKAGAALHDARDGGSGATQNFSEISPSPKAFENLEMLGETYALGAPSSAPTSVTSTSNFGNSLETQVDSDAIGVRGKKRPLDLVLERIKKNLKTKAHSQKEVQATPDSTGFPEAAANGLQEGVWEGIGPPTDEVLTETPSGVFGETAGASSRMRGACTNSVGP